MSTTTFRHDPSTGAVRARTFLIAAGCVIATSAVVLNTTGGEAMQKAMHALGFGRDTAIAAAQQQQAVAIATLEDRLTLVLGEIDGLKWRQNRAATDPAVSDRLTRIDSELAKLHAASGKLAEAQSDTSEELGHVRAALANADIGIAQLRVSIDEGNARQRNAASDIKARMDRLDHAASPSDVTGSIRTGKARRRDHN
jgi:chromosome segregation ATPase